MARSSTSGWRRSPTASTRSAKRLDGAVQAYNEAAGSFESRILVSARRLRELEVTTADELPPADPIERVPRVLKQVGLMGLPDEALTEPRPTRSRRSVARGFRADPVPSRIYGSPMSDPCQRSSRHAHSTSFVRSSPDDLKAGRHGRAHTRFPPEPNGYLHIGHAKSICLNFGVAEEFGGICNLRFDDTNPAKEDTEYVESIQQDVRWLGFDWAERMFYASDYFEQMYAFAEQLIRDGHAYVDSLTADEIREYRGTLTEPGRNSPYREQAGGGESRSVPPHARRRVCRWRARAARHDRHGVAEHQHARPDAVSHPARDTPSDRRRLVHLSDLRLRAPDLRRDRRHHALALHAGVRGPSAALRLGGGSHQPRGPRSGRGPGRSNSPG